MPATILVAEDDPTILAVLAEILEDEGYRVLRARDGAEALARLDRERPDLLVTDERMPHASGTALIAHLRRAPGRVVPAILISAHVPAALPPGVAFIAKPFSLGQVLAAVARQLAAP